MFVDDEPAILSGLQRMLRPKRNVWEMRFAPSGLAALQILDGHEVDVVVSDFRMPAMNGGQLLAEVCRRKPEAARIILSGHTDEKELIAVASVAHQFLTKPCAPAELIAAVERSLRVRDGLATELLRSQVGGIGALPTAPSVLRDLLAVFGRGDSGTASVAGVVQRDIGLTTKVLQLVNSPFFCGPGRVASIEDAVDRLGIQTVRSLALTDDLQSTSHQLTGPSTGWLTDLNLHAVRVAQLARQLAPPGTTDEAFSAAILLEIGQLVLATCRPEQLAAHLRMRQELNRSLADLESETLGVTHAQAGAYLLNLWGFSIGVVEAVANHTSSLSAAIVRPETGPQAALLAHHLVEASGSCMCGDGGAGSIRDEDLAAAGLLRAVTTWRYEREMTRS